MEYEIKLIKGAILNDYKLWQQAPVQTEVEQYYRKRLRDSINRLLKLVPDYTNDLKTTMVSELEAKIRKELK